MIELLATITGIALAALVGAFITSMYGSPSPPSDREIVGWTAITRPRPSAEERERRERENRNEFECLVLAQRQKEFVNRLAYEELCLLDAALSGRPEYQSLWERVHFEREYVERHVSALERKLGVRGLKGLSNSTLHGLERIAR